MRRTEGHKKRQKGTERDRDKVRISDTWRDRERET